MLRYINKAFLKVLRRYLDQVQCKCSIKVQYFYTVHNGEGDVAINSGVHRKAVRRGQIEMD